MRLQAAMAVLVKHTGPLQQSPHRMARCVVQRQHRLVVCKLTRPLTLPLLQPGLLQSMLNQHPATMKRPCAWISSPASWH